MILAVPISQFEATVRRVLPLMKQSGILVDVCTVKGYTVEVLQRLAQGRYWIATHPMFGPESYKKRHGDMSEFRIVLAKERFLPERIYQTAKAWLKNLRLCIVEMTADQHDRHTATTLFLTHYVGQVVATAGFDRTEIDTVSFGFLMDAVDSVRNDKELFTQVYIRNPYCLEVRQRFATAQSEVDGLLAQAIGAPLPIPCAAK